MSSESLLAYCTHYCCRLWQIDTSLSLTYASLIILSSRIQTEWHISASRSSALCYSIILAGCMCRAKFSRHMYSANVTPQQYAGNFSCRLPEPELCERSDYRLVHFCSMCLDLDISVLLNLWRYSSTCRLCFHKHVEKREFHFKLSSRWNGSTHRASVELYDDLRKWIHKYTYMLKSDRRVIDHLKIAMKYSFTFCYWHGVEKIPLCIVLCRLASLYHAKVKSFQIQTQQRYISQGHRTAKNKTSNS